MATAAALDRPPNAVGPICVAEFCRHHWTMKFNLSYPLVQMFFFISNSASLVSELKMWTLMWNCAISHSRPRLIIIKWKLSRTDQMYTSSCHWNDLSEF
jgi:hypothetical protein